MAQGLNTSFSGRLSSIMDVITYTGFTITMLILELAPKQKKSIQLFAIDLAIE